MIFQLIFVYLFVLKDILLVNGDLTGSVDTTTEEFPFNAIVSGKKSCGGALITENFVITPAHCIKGSSSVMIYLGYSRPPYVKSNLQEEKTLFFISNDFFIHEEFEEVKKNIYLNDIALVKLSPSVVLSDRIRPGKFLFKSNTQLHEERFAHITGWKIGQNTNLQVQMIELLDPDTCIHLYGQSFFQNQFTCYKIASSSTFQDLVGNIVTLNRKIVGYLAPSGNSCIHIPSVCKNTRTFFNLIPYLGWISQKVNVPIVDLTGEGKSKKSDLSLIKIEALIGLIRKTKKDIDQELADIRSELGKPKDNLSSSKTLNNV